MKEAAKITGEAVKAGKIYSNTTDVDLLPPKDSARGALAASIHDGIRFLTSNMPDQQIQIE